MAYLTQDDDEKKKALAHPMLAGFGVRAEGSLTGPTAAPSPAGANPQQPATGAQAAPGAPSSQYNANYTASNGFIPYAAYQEANRTGAQRMAQDVASDVGGAAEKAKQGLGQAVGGFNAQVDAGSPFKSPNAQAQLASWYGGGARGPMTEATPGAAKPKATPYGQVAPLAASGAPGGISTEEARKRAGQAYTGPSAIEAMSGWGDLASQTQTAQDRLAQTKDTEGLQALAQEKYGAGGHGYTAGQSRLDAALTGGAGAGAFEALRSKYGDLVGAQQAAMKSADLGADRAASTTSATAGAYGEQADAAEKVDASNKAIIDAKNAANNRPFDPNNPNAKPGDKPRSAAEEAEYRRQILEAMHAGGDMLGNLSTTWKGLGLPPDQQEQLLQKMTPDELRQFVEMNQRIDRYQHGSMFTDDKSRYQSDPYAEAKAFLAQLKAKYGLEARPSAF